ncbi:response regulator transcription factor [Idiomarina seosinensis]|uniref:Two-component system response regulator n=1 Tax=Idiomarina seosinensis TaxID=281739 RepID=A0A432ZDW9_9GAMM|nr:response regulator [Idiomarina seosinensis]RUO76146.1 two-component system response regulator [Idiomarina seosinensis]
MSSVVIIIDDDTTFRDVLQRRLSQQTSYYVLAFDNECAALRESVDSVHAIFLDMRLADSSGLDAIARLREQFNPRHLIMLTGYASIATSVEAMRRGATDYLAKPVGLSELLQRISHHDCTKEKQGSALGHTPMTPAQVEWEHIQRVLLTYEGNISAAAKALGMHRRTLQRKLKKFSPYGRAN